MAINRDVLIRALMRGKCLRVAAQLNIPKSTVSMVNQGKRHNLDVSKALLDEEARVIEEADKIIADQKARKKEIRKKVAA
jgi:hypothetical protein